MQERGIALGWRGLPAGALPTYSWREFFELALSYRLLTAAELDRLATNYAQIWNQDLHNN